jgi:hypothetical protein
MLKARNPIKVVLNFKEKKQKKIKINLKNIKRVNIITGS